MPSARSLWSQKLSGLVVGGSSSSVPAKTTRPPKVKPLPLPRASFHGIALGIDSSVRGTGLAVIDCSGGVLRLLESKTVKIPPKIPFLSCLGIIHREVVSLLHKYEIGRVGVEETIFVQNFQTVQLLGCARGAALGPISAAGIEIIQLSPKSIKQAVTFTGGADKALVQRMVSSMLGCSLLAPDEADAAGAAIAASFGRVGIPAS